MIEIKINFRGERGQILLDFFLSFVFSCYLRPSTYSDYIGLYNT